MSKSKQDTVQSVERAISILKAFSQESPELGVAELSSATGLPKSTVSRLLATLKAGGLIAQNPNNDRYQLGVDLIGLANNVVEYADVRRLAAAPLRELADELGETVSLTVLDGLEAVNLDQYAPSGRMVFRVGWVGRRMPVHAVSSGKAILAFLPEQELNSHLGDPLPPKTENTITEPDVLTHELAKVRKDGFATAFEELEVGLHAISAPVFNHKSRPVASVSVSGPSYRLTRTQIKEIASDVLSVSKNLAALMGHGQT